MLASVLQGNVLRPLRTSVGQGCYDKGTAKHTLLCICLYSKESKSVMLCRECIAMVVTRAKLCSALIGYLRLPVAVYLVISSS